jgi:two-component system, OmpR family, response regulator
VIRRRDLLAAGWPDGALVHDNTLHSFATRLRRKLRAVGAEMRIETVRGVGYTLR